MYDKGTGEKKNQRRIMNTKQDLEIEKTVKDKVKVETSRTH